MSVFTEQSIDLQPFRDWRDSLSAAEREQQRFDEWLFLNASSVLLSEKTGELLTFSLEEFGKSPREVEAGLSRLAEMWDFSFRLLYESNDLLKLIVYQKDRLQAVLDEAPFCIMGAKLHYRYPLTSESFIEELRRRWHRHARVPHEIGVALGYPLDDVFGYMGLLSLPCLGVCGWQVYGCMKESKRRSCAFNNARCQALIFLAKANASAV
ncbi:MAG TPA: DUF3793 family protein [Opitutales bacterium]|nr:DUF3793 family protein [Opitutales bacterium]